MAKRAKQGYVATLPDKPHTPLKAKSGVEWRIGKLSPASSVLVVATLVGLVCGGAAFLLKSVIEWVSDLLSAQFFPAGGGLAMLLLPIVGICAAIFFQKRIVNRNLEHGVEQLSDSLERHDYNVPSVLTIAPGIASTLTLAFGGSAGAEGPIATTGAAIGSNTARIFGMPPALVRVMVGCGAGAGIAGIFQAPIAGALFTFEVLRMEMSTVPSVALFLASLVAGLTAYALSGFTLNMPLADFPVFSPEMSGWAILLGVFCGLYSLYYTAFNVGVRHLLERIPNAWVRGIVSAIALGLCLWAFPVLYSEGYPAMSKIISGDYSPLSQSGLFATATPTLLTLTMICLGVALLKTIACALSNSGGGVCGEFAPTLFAGCMAGFIFGSGVVQLTGSELPIGAFALVGMGAVMAGTIRAPLMAIFIVAEMTGSYTLLFPLTIASFISYLIVRAGSELNLLRMELRKPLWESK